MRTILKSTTLLILAIIVQPATAATIFSENMGSVASTTSIATHTTNSGWENDDLTFSGTGDVRSTNPSNTYTGASGNANVFLTNNATSSFQIGSIDTTLFEPTFTISFGAHKHTNASNMSELVFEYSSDGISYTAIPIPAQPTGTGTAIWRLITLSDITLPNVSDLRLRWRNSSSGSGTPQFRVDDVMLTGTEIPEPTTLVLFGIAAIGLISARRKLLV